ncbi:MAG: alanine--tRNA ligase, partial [Pseudohongiellaceae bacterium]
PANVGRGYVLRRIIRRVIRHGHQLGVTEPFFYQLVAVLAEEMGEAYPELVKAAARVSDTLHKEEELFARTLDNGMAILDQAIAELEGKEIPGETVFKLYDTYGFPVDLTADIAREKGLSIDQAGFEQAMAAQKAMARSASRFESGATLDLGLDGETAFLGYEQLTAEATVQGLFRDGQPVSGLAAGEAGMVVLDSTAFYAESGGQVGDIGQLLNSSAVFDVGDTIKQGALFLHLGTMRMGKLETGDRLRTQVDARRRHNTMLNHSATHLMHAALRKVLGEHVTQKGSLVHPDYLRFDFSHDRAMGYDQIKQVEDLVNEQILANSEVHKRTMPIDDARKLGAVALFGEKYGDQVRVVSMGVEADSTVSTRFSIEFCGGTHVNRTGDIGWFKITQESGVAAGVRRIEAVTGRAAFALARENEEKLKTIAAIIKSGQDAVVDRVQQLASSNRTLEKEIEQLKARLASSAGTDLSSQAEAVKDVMVLTAAIDGLSSKALRDTVDQLKNKLGSAVVVLATIEANKVSLVAGVTRDVTDRIKAGDVVNMVAQQVGGKGGGRPDMAMAGGNKPEKLGEALKLVKPYVERSL